MAETATEEAKAKLQGAEHMVGSIEELRARVASLEAGQAEQGLKIDGLRRARRTTACSSAGSCRAKRASWRVRRTRTGASFPGPRRRWKPTKQRRRPTWTPTRRARREQATRKAAAAHSADAALQGWKFLHGRQYEELLKQRVCLASLEARFAADQLQGDVLRARRNLAMLCMSLHPEIDLVDARAKLAEAEHAVFAVLPRSPGGLSLQGAMAAEPPSPTWASAPAELVSVPFEEPEPPAVSALEPPSAAVRAPRPTLGALSPHRATNHANQKPWASPQRPPTGKKRSKSSPAK